MQAFLREAIDLTSRAAKRSSLAGVSISDEAEPSPVKREVDILGEPLDQAVDLRQGCATLEDEPDLVEWKREETLEGPTDPEVLLNNRIGQVSSGADLLEEVGALFRGPAGDIVQGSALLCEAR